MAKPEKIDLDRELRKRIAYNRIDSKDKNTNMVFNENFWQDRGHQHDADSVFFDPFFVSDNSLGNIRTMSRTQYGGIAPKTLRAVAQKAWIINVCINHIIKKIKPFLKPSSDRNVRGFIIVKQGETLGKTQKNDKIRDEIRDFILHTGNYEDTERDDFTKYCVKIVRDLLTLDQISTEMQYRKDGRPCAFFAVDAGTVEKVIPEDKTNTIYTYMQVVDGMPAAGYTSDTMIFDYENPRTDIHHSQYGYSYVEQAIDLITSVINTFSYNAGNFTENKLPKGMLLINGDTSPEVVEEMEDYIAEIMSGGPLNQWRIPIIPSGQKESGIEWKSLAGNNREMEFQGWLDYLTSGVVAMFGCSMDELGIQSQKSQAMFENGGSDRIQASKSLILGDILTFLESYINKIIFKINPEYSIEFVGYEKDNPSTVADLDEKECRTWKSINEKREEKGLKPIDLTKIENLADLPMNVQLVQLFQSQQMGGDMQGGEDAGEGENDDWANYGNQEDNESDVMEEENPADVPTEENENDVMEEEPVNKSYVVKSMLSI